MANQLDLSLPVAVCAWCKPQERGSGVGQVSHGICPHHLRKIQWELQGIPAPRRRYTRRRPTSAELLPL